MAALLLIGSAEVYALTDFMNALPPDQINEARRSGLMQMRHGFKQELTGALLMRENPSSPHDDADGILTKALAASAAGFASAMTRDDKAAIGDPPRCDHASASRPAGRSSQCAVLV